MVESLTSPNHSKGENAEKEEDASLDPEERSKLEES